MGRMAVLLSALFIWVMNKDEIREEVRTKRSALQDGQRRHAGRIIAHNIFNDIPRLLLSTYNWNIYLSSKLEVPTRYIVRRLYAERKQVSVPRWDPTMQCYELNDFPPGMPLIQGPMKIPEPLEFIPVHPSGIDCFIVPGLAFDYRGGRLGYGGGHYDRILAKASRNALKIGVCFDFQLYSTSLPMEAHDVLLDYIVTERRTIHCRKYRGEV